MIVVGLTGLAGAGKDTAADHMVANYGFTKMAMAGPLKRVLGAMNPIIGMDVMNPGRYIHLNDAIAKYGELGVKKVYPEYRRLAQTLGTEGIRAEDPNFWVKCFTTKLHQMHVDSRIVVTDVRFANESLNLRTLNPDFYTTELWHIHGRGGEQGAAAGHASESQAGNLLEHLTVNNTQDVPYLNAQIDELVKSLIEVEQVKRGGA